MSEAGGQSGASPQLPLQPIPQDIDAVTALQDQVDVLALAVFDSIRLLPVEMSASAADLATEASASGAEANGETTATAASSAAWEQKVKALADNVVRQAQQLDKMIAALPGADQSEEQQLQGLADLKLRSEQLHSELESKHAEAKALADRADALVEGLAQKMFTTT